MEEKIKYYIEEYRYESGSLVGHQGGYPIITLTFNENTKMKNASQKELDKLIRRAEMSAGRELGVGLNFRRTAYVTIQENQLIVSGYVTIIDKVLYDLSKM